jgi:hypothetical protein
MLSVWAVRSPWEQRQVRNLNAAANTWRPNAAHAWYRWCWTEACKMVPPEPDDTAWTARCCGYPHAPLSARPDRIRESEMAQIWRKLVKKAFLLLCAREKYTEGKKKKIVCANPRTQQRDLRDSEVPSRPAEHVARHPGPGPGPRVRDTSPCDRRADPDSLISILTRRYRRVLLSLYEGNGTRISHIRLIFTAHRLSGWLMSVKMVQWDTP